MDQGCNALWAKKCEKNGRFYWLPLTVHLEDTGSVAGWLWNHWLSDGQRAYLVGEMRQSGREVDEETAEKLVRFLGLIHDLGKATPVFQIQRSYSNSQDLDHILLERLENAGFSGISNLILASPEKTHHTLAGEVLLHDFDILDDIASIVGAHHGSPISERIEYTWQKSYPKNYYQSEDINSPIALRWKLVQKKIFEWALSESELDLTVLPEISQPAQVILSGLLIMADWIASNENYFPLADVSDNDSLALDQNERFASGMQKWFRDLPFSVSTPDNAEILFQKRFGFSPRSFQRTIFSTIQNIADPGIVVIEAKTGCGKTEAALAAAEQLAAATGRSGLFFGLPTQATANGLFERIVKWTESVAEEYGSTSIRLLHGKANLNPLMRKLKRNSWSVEPDASNIDTDGETGGTVSVNEWFSGRKTAILDDFVIGTVDQLLLMALQQKHLALRHLGFSRKVVIIDEVHAYDVYMQQYLKEALRWLGAYRVPVILLSATLPKDIRISLIHEYLMGRGAKSRDLKQRESSLLDATYPLITFSDGNDIRQNDDFKKEPDRDVNVKHLQEENFYDTLSMLYQEEGAIGVIVNTVRRAQAIAQHCCELFGRDSVELLHAEFIATDRIAKEKKLMHMIGKGAERPKRKIIIGTQVLEQSLDIDFDVLITDLCPMDLLIQRIGRLHRHDIARPKAHEKSVVYVLGESDTGEFESGSSHIYGDYLLERTQAALPEVLHIPSDVSPLVQQVYDFDGEPLLCCGAVSERQCAQMKADFDSHREREEKKALHFRIDKPYLRINPERYNLIGWLDSKTGAENEEKACAQVRDTKEILEVVAVRQRDNGYGIYQSEEDLSAKLTEGETAYELAQQTLRLPYAVTAGNRIDQVIKELENYNRKYLPEWQEQPWLKGSLGIIFNRQDQFKLGETMLQYDSFLGLRIVEDSKNGPV